MAKDLQAAMTQRKRSRQPDRRKQAIVELRRDLHEFEKQFFYRLGRLEEMVRQLREAARR